MQAADGFQLQDLRCVKCTSVATNHLQQHCDVCGGHLRATQMPVGAAASQLLSGTCCLLTCWGVLGGPLLHGWWAGWPSMLTPRPPSCTPSERLQAQARQQFSVLRNIAEYQGMPLLGELAAWQLQRGGAGCSSGSGGGS